MPHAGEGIGTRKTDSGLKPGEVAWPDNARSMVVIAVLHPEDEPEMDWWFGRKDPPGNRVLAKICRDLCPWIEERFGIHTVHLPYHVEKGGTYLKDAAVMAGLGCIGKNNILVTPEFGPRVRLRALTVDADLFATGPRQFDPCTDCMEFCRRACPQKAFDKRQYTAEDYGQPILPGRDGHYSRPVCNVQMEKDNDTAETQPVDGFDDPVKIIKYCRRCELACPVGKPLKTPAPH
jgi:epoxyqueuosine reductase